MKKILQVCTLAVASGMGVTQLYAQGGDAGTITKALGDADKIANAYMSPLMKAFGVGLNGGWFNTAKPHGIGGFDITISANAPFAPTADQTYDMNTLGLTKVRPLGTNTIGQTVFGTDKNGPDVGVYAPSPITGNDTMITQFQLPPGSGVNFGVVPTAQINVGVGFGTEVAIRYSPELSLGSANAGLFGFAVKHDIKQWIPGIKEMPFDLSVMFGYTSVHASVKMDPQISGASSDTMVYNPNANKKYTNQKVELESKGWTTNVLLSKKLGPLTPYLGLGYQTSSTSLKLAGTYPVQDLNTTFDPLKGWAGETGGVPNNPAYNPADANSHPMIVKEVQDPIDIKGDVGGFRATLGLRLKLAILTIHGDYTFSEYNMASIGIGLNIQSIAPFKL